nr:MAG TPA: hypothetical protein [Caudoviricetes sp.]DAM26225.1 MAG TPA: hypothetical protein [Caudoviricetes sp.]
MPLFAHLNMPCDHPLTVCTIILYTIDSMV